MDANNNIDYSILLFNTLKIRIYFIKKMWFDFCICSGPTEQVIPGGRLMICIAFIAIEFSIYPKGFLK